MDIETLKEDLERITGGRVIDPGEKMSEVLARLDAHGQSAEAPERLKHYLSRRSYVKALAWLDNPETPHRP